MNTPITTFTFTTLDGQPLEATITSHGRLALSFDDGTTVEHAAIEIGWSSVPEYRAEDGHFYHLESRDYDVAEQEMSTAQWPISKADYQVIDHLYEMWSAAQTARRRAQSTPLSKEEQAKADAMFGDE